MSVLVGLDDVVLTYGGKPLFEKLRLHIRAGEKICLIGKNGAGKTTLMRLIQGELELDGGKRFAAPGIRIGYLAQTVYFRETQTVREFVLSGLPESDELSLEECQHRADRAIEPLQLAPETVMSMLSGGQLRRAALARALVADPDLLMLDEPTNHLDLEGIEWLEQMLSHYRGALVCVSHDRAFLNHVSRTVFWIDRGIVRVCPSGYAGFEEWAAKQIEQEARALSNLQKKLAAEEDWMHGGVTARRKRNQRRLSELHRLREKLRADNAAHRARFQKIELDALAPQLASKRVVEFKNVTKSFACEGKKIPILNDFNLRLMRGDRLGLLGKNGSGKTTFLKLLVGELTPDSGRITHGKSIELTYFDQNRSVLDPTKTLWETLCPEGGDHVFLRRGEELTSRHVCAYLKDFLFDPKSARDRVSTLSGGQQNRLLLARALAKPGNVLILDEPTNDLDMDTLDMLQEVLAEYPGTLVIVSHDRDFLDRTVTEVLAFEGNAVVEGHLGGYSDYLNAKKQKELLQQQKEEKHFLTRKPVEAKPAEKDKKISFKLHHERAQIPLRIAALEAEISAIKTQLADADFYQRDPDAFDAAATRLARAERELDAAETRWLELEAVFG